MAKITDDLRDKIISDYNIGKSQNSIAEKYNLSPATINKICKGLTPKYKEKVNTVVAIESELSHESEYQSECFYKEVNDLLRNKRLIFSAQQKAVRKATTMLDQIDSASDLKAIIDGIDKASITLGVSQRHASTTINNTNAVQNEAPTVVFQRIGNPTNN
jgi:DNA-binding XRE family transcriptional regulator